MCGDQIFCFPRNRPLSTGGWSDNTERAARVLKTRMADPIKSKINKEKTKLMRLPENEDYDEVAFEKVNGFWY